MFANYQPISCHIFSYQQCELNLQLWQFWHVHHLQLHQQQFIGISICGGFVSNGTTAGSCASAATNWKDWQWRRWWFHWPISLLAVGRGIFGVQSGVQLPIIGHFFFNWVIYVRQY